MSLHRRLIDLYGSDGIQADKVVDLAAFRKLAQEHEGDMGFEAERQRVYEIKKYLEKILNDRRHISQIQACIKLLSDPQFQKLREDYHALIKAAYWPHWSMAQQQHYDMAYTVLIGNTHYFLSYTNRSTGLTKIPLSVNKIHRYLIYDLLWQDPKDLVGDPERDSTRRNLLALGMHSFLRDRGLEGFYYEEHEGDSSVVMNKLDVNLKRMMTFVQLVQLTMFGWKDSNYCHFEYDQASKSPTCQKRIYLLAESRQELLDERPKVSGVYDPWYSEIVDQRDPLQLESTEDFNDEVVRRNREVIKKKIRDQIIKIRNDLLQRVPEE